MAPKRKQQDTKPTHASLAKDEQAELLKFLLNDASAEYSTLDVVKESRGSKVKQPNLFDHIELSKNYTPFQILISTVLMSKPISSRLGVRSLMYLFGEDNNLDTPTKLKEAGVQEIHDILDTARTQHKEKTANQIVGVAEIVSEKYQASEDDVTLERFREEMKGSPDNLADCLKQFKGIGPVGEQIFRRRIQELWEEFYPFADDRCLHAAEYLGFRDDNAESLAEHVKELLPVDDAEEERRQFARIVNSLIAADLENKLDDLYDRFGSGNDEEKKDEHQDKKQKNG